MSKFFKDLKPHASNNRNVFDLTRTSTFSSKSGMIQPCFVQETVPDGKYKIDVNGIIRTLPMQNANFTTLKANMEFFFVPYSQLWHYFNQFYYGRGDQHRTPSSTIALDTQPLCVPTFGYRQICEMLINNSLCQLYFEYMMRFVSYLDTLKISDFTIGANVSEYDVETLFARYRNAAQVFLDGMIKAEFQYALPTSIDSIKYSTFMDVHGRMCAMDMVRNFDLLGYGNLLPFIKTYWNYMFEYYSLGSLFETTFSFSIPEGESDPVMTISNSDGHFTDVYNMSYQLFVADIYGLNSANTSTDYSGAAQDLFSQVEHVSSSVAHTLDIDDYVPDVAPNPFRIMAFFKIWNDYYRNSQYDNLPYHTLFNADYLNTAGSAKNFEYYRVINMLRPNYHQYKKDRFTGSYPDSQFGDVAVAGLNNPATINYSGKLPEGQNPAYYMSLALTSKNAGADLIAMSNGVPAYGTNSWTIGSSISVLAIRQAQALQRWKEKILRSGNREKDLQDAIFGVKSKYIEDGYVDFLGSCDGTINVNPVAATASTETAEIGELGAFAVGSISGDTINYEAQDFGVIIGVLYVMPETKYDSFGLDAFNTKVLPDDFYKPDFQNLGLAPVFSSDFNIFNKIEKVNGVQQSNIKVLGYLSRYYEYKTALNKVHGEFFGTNPLLTSLELNSVAGIEMSQSNFPFTSCLLRTQSGADASLVSVRDVRDFIGMTLAACYCSPEDVNSLFYQASDGSQLTDQFKYECQFTCKAILPMSVEGLPY